MKVRLLKRLRRLSKRKMFWWIDNDSRRGRFICIYIDRCIYQDDGLRSRRCYWADSTTHKYFYPNEFVRGVNPLENYFETDEESLEILRRAQRSFIKCMLDNLRNKLDRHRMDKLSNTLGKKL